MSETILVVDDEAEITHLLEIYLKNEGFEVQPFYRAKEALAYLDHHPVDLALLDVMLPDMDGFLLLTHIREKFLFPVIMLTAKVEDMDKITGLSWVRMIISQNPSIRWKSWPGSRPSCVAIRAIILPPRPCRLKTAMISVV